MKQRQPEVADILREHFYSYCQSMPVSPMQRRVAGALIACRTASLGGHRLKCTHCEHREISYNSCRNRHCPKCQASAGAKWLDERCKDLLPVPYFHVVFTLPEQLAPLALQNKALVYGLLIRTAAQTLTKIAADERHLGGRIGLVTVLHTWGQTLRHHPHVHCVVPGGGLAPDGDNGPDWIPCRPKFFLPVRVLSRLFRARFLQGLDNLRKLGELEYHGQLKSLTDSGQWYAYLRPLRGKDWVVYSKAPFGGPEQVLKYLARYTHRVAISNRRIKGIAGGAVSFDWKDYANGNAKKVMRLPALEFLRRFLLHVLPKGFQRIRYYGFLANRIRGEALETVRALIDEGNCGGPQTVAPRHSPAHSVSKRACPECEDGILVIVTDLAPALPCGSPGQRRAIPP